MCVRPSRWVWVLDKGKVVEWDETGRPLRMAGTHLDIHDRKQTELRLELQNLVLGQIAQAEPLPTILDTLVRATEDQLEDCCCSILLCNRQGKLHSGVAPHLPAVYNQAIDGMSIGAAAGSCGTAAFRKQLVIVSDIATDPLWQDYQELALAHGLLACWSMPVIASDGSVIATFAVYHREIHRPQEQELEVIALVANIAKIAIEREQATQALEQLNRELETRVVLRTAALQRSEARLREAQQVARLGHWELDLRTGSVTWSAEFLNIFGLDLDEADLNYEQFLQNHFLLQEREQFNQLIDSAIQTGEPQETDLKMIRTDGSSGYIFAKAELIQHLEGPASRLFGIVMDVTDRKTIQAALQRSEERARATLLALPDIVFRVNRAGRYVEFLVSPPGRNLIDPTHVAGKYLHEVLTPEIAEAHAATQYAALQEALATQTVQIYEQQILLDGDLCYEEVRVAPCGNDEVVFFVRDISDRKRSEAERKQAEQIIRQQADREKLLREVTQRIRQSLDLQTSFDTACQEIRSVLQVDRVGIFQFYPDSSFNSGEFVAESVAEAGLSVVAIPIHDHCFGENYAALYAQGRFSANDDINVGITACHIDILAQLQVRANLVVPLICQEQLWGLLCLHQCHSIRHWQQAEIDFTQQLANQLAIAIQQAHLFGQLQQELVERQQAEAKLTEINQQLAISNQELARATRLKDEFLANMSHELRTPLNAILGMTDGLQEQVFGPINERQIKALKTIERSGSHLLELINDILDVAKIEAGQLELDYSPTSIAELCQSSLSFVKQQALQKRIQLEMKLPSHTPDLLLDERRIRQVLINLLNNAVKFTPEGGRVILEVTRSAALPAANSDSDNLSAQAFLGIAVIDTGIGIAPEHIQKLFQPFIQIDSALNRKYEGTGLGLALVKRITELHGGRVTLTSELSQGSRFTIELPYTPSSLDSLESSPITSDSLPISDADQLAYPGSQILLAEDNEANISTISSYLTAKGYQILLAKDGQAAIDLAKIHQPDLILMDIQMPGIDGLEATRQIRLDPDLADIPIIALTALAMAGDRERCLEAGANNYLTKPVKLKQLATTIQQFLDKSKKNK